MKLNPPILPTLFILFGLLKFMLEMLEAFVLIPPPFIEEPVVVGKELFRWKLPCGPAGLSVLLLLLLLLLFILFKPPPVEVLPLPVIPFMLAELVFEVEMFVLFLLCWPGPRTPKGFLLKLKRMPPLLFEVPFTRGKVLPYSSAKALVARATSSNSTKHIGPW